MGVSLCFSERFCKISYFDCEQYGKNQYKKKKHKQHCSMFKVITFIIFKCHRSIDNFIDFYFFSCRKKAHDNKEFSRGNSKPRNESGVTTRPVKPWEVSHSD